MSEKLKPCPFCGYKHIKIYKEDDISYHGECCNPYCAIIGPVAGTEQAAINAWNRRK